MSDILLEARDLTKEFPAAGKKSASRSSAGEKRAVFGRFRSGAVASSSTICVRMKIPTGSVIRADPCRSSHGFSRPARTSVCATCLSPMVYPITNSSYASPSGAKATGSYWLKAK